MVETSCEEQLKAVTERLDANKFMVLSTSKNDNVTSRTVCYANQGLVIYVLTGKRTTKYKQVESNPRVSLCLGNMQIQGTAEVTGSPGDDGNLEGSRIFSLRHQQYFKRFAHFKAAAFLKIACEKITLWTFEDGRDCYHVLDVLRHRAMKHR